MYKLKVFGAAITNSNSKNSMTCLNGKCQNFIAKNGEGLNDFTIGGLQRWGRHTVDADIAIVRVYNRVLSVTEVKSNYANFLRRLDRPSIVPTRLWMGTPEGTVGRFEGCLSSEGDDDFKNPFRIDGLTGQLYLKDDFELNYERKQMYGIEVTVVDSGLQTLSVDTDNVLTTLNDSHSNTTVTSMPYICLRS
jgi:hypothetical protein